MLCIIGFPLLSFQEISLNIKIIVKPGKKYMTNFLNSKSPYSERFDCSRLLSSIIKMFESVEGPNTFESSHSLKVKRKHGPLLSRLSSERVSECSRQLTRSKALSRVNESVVEKSSTNILPLNDLDFDVPFAKKVFLSFWVKKYLIVQPGHHILTSELYKLYRIDLDKEYTYQALLDERTFFQNIAMAMAIFGLKAVKVRITGGRGYAGIRYVDRSKDHLNKNYSEIGMELEMENMSSNYKNN